MCWGGRPLADSLYRTVRCTASSRKVRKRKRRNHADRSLGGWFLLTYDHGRRQEVIEETRNALVRLTALLDRTDNQD